VLLQQSKNMGKKKVIKQTQEEILQEGEAVEGKIKKTAPAKSGRGIRVGCVYISSTYNNTIITLADEHGKVLSWSSAGRIGFKGTKKGTPYAANKVAEVVAQTIQNLKISEIRIKVKGIGGGRESAARALAAHGIEILSVEDMTPVPHNGCKRRKPRHP